METPSDKLLSYAANLYSLVDDIFGRLYLLTPEEVSRIDHIPIQDGQAVEGLNSIRMMVLNTEKLVNKAISELFFLSESADVRDWLRQRGPDAIWRFIQLKKLVDQRLRPLFNSLVSPIGRSNLDIKFPLETSDLLFDYCDWLVLLCEEAESDDSSLSDIDKVTDNLTGQSHELFIRLARHVPKQGRPGRYASFDDIKAEGIVNSDDDEAVLKAIKRLKDKLVGTPYDLKQDTRRVRLERISPDK